MSSWAELRLSVQVAVATGMPLARIDAELISTAPVDPQRRAALWLYAWALADTRGGRPAAAPARRPAGALEPGDSSLP